MTNYVVSKKNISDISHIRCSKTKSHQHHFRQMAHESISYHFSSIPKFSSVVRIKLFIRPSSRAILLAVMKSMSPINHFLIDISRTYRHKTASFVILFENNYYLPPTYYAHISNAQQLNFLQVFFKKNRCFKDNSLIELKCQHFINTIGYLKSDQILVMHEKLI
jgi:hypothetical protein